MSEPINLSPQAAYRLLHTHWVGGYAHVESALRALTLMSAPSSLDAGWHELWITEGVVRVEVGNGAAICGAISDTMDNGGWTAPTPAHDPAPCPSCAFVARWAATPPVDPKAACPTEDVDLPWQDPRGYMPVRWLGRQHAEVRGGRNGKTGWRWRVVSHRDPVLVVGAGMASTQDEAKAGADACLVMWRRA